MLRIRKNLLFKLLVFVTVFLFSFCGAIFALPNKGQVEINAKAEMLEYQDLLGIENRAWGAHEGEYYFGGMDSTAYFNAADSVCGTWYHGNDAIISANNGVDIMEYILINGVSARQLITNNVNGANLTNSCGCWLSNPAASPVYVETTNGSGILIRILKSFVGDSFTITFKAGFSLIRNDGQTIYVSDDIIYNCVGNAPTKVQKSTVTFKNENGAIATTKRVVTGQAIGELPAVPEKAGCVGFWKADGVGLTEETIISADKTATPVYALDYTDLLGLEDRTSWGAHTNEYYFGGMDSTGYFNTAASVCGTWYHGNNAVISANNGVDIMKYILINGVSARELITNNVNGANLANSCGCWLSNPAACPVYVETTNGSGIMIRLLKSVVGENFTITFKKGFSLIRNDGQVVYLTGDVTYTYANGTLGGRTVEKTYTLSFEGSSEIKTVTGGQAIGALPAVPEKAGCEGVWMIDGVAITANTVYNYGANKTATVVYSKNITNTINLGDWGVPASESDIRYLWVCDNGANIATSYPNSYWNDHADNKDSNFGVDIMEYILIDDESARSIINKNAAGTTSYKAASTFPLNMGGCYAPVCIETAGGEGIRFKVMVDYKTSFKVTFKAGFTLVTSEGIKLYTTEDVVYRVGATMNDIKKVMGNTLTFEGTGDVRDIEDGQVIGELPAVPEKEGYVGVWTIDGVEITANTVYNYGQDKTAVAVYTKDITETVKIEFTYHNSVDSKFKIFINPTSALTSNAWWNISDVKDNLIAANNGVDIMDYIYINGENIRALSDGNRTNNTYPVGSATGWFTNSDQCRPVFVETNSEGIWVNVLHSFSGEEYTLTLKAGFAILDAAGGASVINKDVEFICISGGGVTKVKDYTLSFEGISDTITVKGGKAIGDLPTVPEEDGYEGVWTIDGVEIDASTLYMYDSDKTATASYRKDITKYLALEDRAWGAHSGEFYFGVLDKSITNVTDEGENHYLNSSIADCWYHGNDAVISANNGIDIMEYIYINDKSARQLITENVNGANLTNNCGCWLSNPAASPVYVETNDKSGIMVRVLEAYTGKYFEITFKSGFSILNADGVRVYLSKDITYKYIALEEGNTLAKGELTDADLDMLNGQNITLKDGEEIYFAKKTCRLTLPQPDSFVEDGIRQTFVGWSTSKDTYDDLYPAGYKWNVTENVTLYAKWISFEMQDGAAVRLVNGSSGIRFTVDIEQEKLTLLDNMGILGSYGVLLVPTDYLRGDIKFAHSTFDAYGEQYYMDNDCTGGNWRVNDENESIWTYSAAFVNISAKQYSRCFSARGYLQIEYANGEFSYIYTAYDEEQNARSIYEVALGAYADEENPSYKTNVTILDYINNVANITWDADDYMFARTEGVAGDYEVTDITVNDYVVTVNMTGNITSAVVNGQRLYNGTSSNVKLGDFVFNVSGFEKTGYGFKFNIGAANNTYDKESEESLYFASSDADLDFFLNDYFKRHSGVIENGENLKVNSVTAGVNAKEFFNHEWNSMAYYWYNSFEGYTDATGENENRIEGMRNVLSSVPVDDYGYVWSSNDEVRDSKSDISTGEQKMGWPFPNNKTVGTSHWEFNENNGSWSSNISATASGGLYGKTLSNQSSNITFTSKSFSSITSGKVYTFYAPLLEFEVRIDDATNIEDIYVWYTTSSSTSFSEDKKLSVKDKAFLNYDLGNTSGAYNHILYLPMYAEAAWGESTSTYMKQLKIEIALKSGKTISGNVALNYVRPTLDTRMSNNNSILISSLRTDYDYTGDLTYLQENITRARKAMNFLMQMYDANRGLKRESYLVGHGGTKEDLSWLGNASNKSIASTISQGYWDILYMPEYDFQSNMYFYKAVRDMAYLEEVLEENGITVNESATVKTATREHTTGTCAYSYDLNAVADTVLNNLRKTTENTNHTGFWDATDGRFVAGYASGEGKWYDYGYVAWNLEAIYYGIATDEQATAIMNWLSNEDNLYKYGFAPMSNTVTGDTGMLNGEYAAQKKSWVNCQFGGAIMYTSFYDLMARIETIGADNAFDRLTAIENWYKEVYNYYVEHGSDPYEFYRYYYDSKNIQCQGMGTAGAVGLDCEFLESFLPVSAVAYGFFGIDSIDGKTLEIAPEKPTELDYWKMENLAFNFVKYDLTIYDNAIQLSNVRGSTSGLQLQIALDYTAGQTIYVNGEAVEADKVENGKAYVLVDFGATIVEVR